MNATRLILILMVLVLVLLVASEVMNRPAPIGTDLHPKPLIRPELQNDDGGKPGKAMPHEGEDPGYPQELRDWEWLYGLGRYGLWG